MTKRRAIYPSSATSLSLARCCPEAQLLFDRLVATADDQGRLQGDPLLVRSQCMPLIDKATTRNVSKWLGELADAKMICRYEADGQPLVQIVQWWKYQDWFRHVYPSRWPAPEGWEPDRVKGNGMPPSSGTLPPDGGSLPATGGTLPLDGGPSRGGGGDVVESESEIETSASRDVRETAPPPPVNLSLSRITTTHFDLTNKKASKGGTEMYADLLEQFGFEVVNRAQWNVGASDKSDRGFIGRVKDQCIRLARQAS